eukprot:3454808-Rhodomonas_salina.1
MALTTWGAKSRAERRAARSEEPRERSKRSRRSRRSTRSKRSGKGEFLCSLLEGRRGKEEHRLVGFGHSLLERGLALLVADAREDDEARQHLRAADPLSAPDFAQRTRQTIEGRTYPQLVGPQRHRKLQRCSGRLGHHALRQSRATLCDMKAVSYDLPKDFRTLTIGNASSAFSCDKAALPALCGREGQSCPALGKRERAFPPNPTPGTAGLTNAEPKASLSEPEKA